MCEYVCVRVCVCLYMYVCVCVHKYVRICVFVCVDMYSIFKSVCVCLHVCGHTSICMRISMSGPLSVYLYT